MDRVATLTNVSYAAHFVLYNVSHTVLNCVPFVPSICNSCTNDRLLCVKCLMYICVTSVPCDCLQSAPSKYCTNQSSADDIIDVPATPSTQIVLLVQYSSKLVCIYSLVSLRTIHIVITVINCLYCQYYILYSLVKIHSYYALFHTYHLIDRTLIKVINCFSTHSIYHCMKLVKL